MSERDMPKADPSGADVFVNFAYGSNMSSRRLQARTPSATALGAGQLVGYRLAWHKVGQDGSAKCDILETGRPEDIVWGVLYRIAVIEKSALDRAEGLGNGYDHRQVEVISEAGPISASVYVATHVDASLRPFDWYLRYVVDGAAEHCLPQHYQEQLRLIGSIADTDELRRQLNWR